MLESPLIRNKKAIMDKMLRIHRNNNNHPPNNNLKYKRKIEFQIEVYIFN